MLGIQRFILSRGGESFDLEYVRDVEGLGIPPVIVTSTPRGWRRDGAMMQWISYEARVFTVAFDFKGASYPQTAAFRRALMRFVGNKEPMTLEYTRFDGMILRLSPVYIASGTTPMMKEQGVLPDALQLVAMNPFFRIEIPFSSATLEFPLFQWPEWGLDWPEWGNDFSMAENEMQVSNTGDVPGDAIIRFIGPAVTPRIDNLTTGEFMEVNRTIEEGETLEINSATGRVDIIDVEGNRHNAFNYVTDDSRLIKLAPGVNNIEFSSAGGAMGYISIGGVEYYASI